MKTVLLYILLILSILSMILIIISNIYEIIRTTKFYNAMIKDLEKTSNLTESLHESNRS